MSTVPGHLMYGAGRVRQPKGEFFEAELGPLRYRSPGPKEGLADKVAAHAADVKILPATNVHLQFPFAEHVTIIPCPNRLYQSTKLLLWEVTTAPVVELAEEIPQDATIDPNQGRFFN